METKKISKAQWILDHIASHPDGMGGGQIIRDLWEHSNGIGSYTPSRRGYWCTALYGGRAYTVGLLNFYCYRDPKSGWWKRNDVDHKGHPWGTMAQASKVQ